MRRLDFIDYTKRDEVDRLCQIRLNRANRTKIQVTKKEAKKQVRKAEPRPPKDKKAAALKALKGMTPQQIEMLKAKLGVKNV